MVMRILVLMLLVMPMVQLTGCKSLQQPFVEGQFLGNGLDNAIHRAELAFNAIQRLQNPGGTPEDIQAWKEKHAKLLIQANAAIDLIRLFAGTGNTEAQAALARMEAAYTVEESLGTAVATD